MLDMGQPVRVLDLAEKMIRLAGQEPYRDVQISFTGLRPGEKLREELMSDAEATVPTGVERIRIVAGANEHGPVVRATLDGLLLAMRNGDSRVLLALIRQLVPECEPPLRLVAGQVVDIPRPSPVPGSLIARPSPAPGALVASAMPLSNLEGS